MGVTFTLYSVHVYEQGFSRYTSCTGMIYSKFEDILNQYNIWDNE